MRTVYIHTTPDGKRYVGATHTNPDVRFKRGHGYRYQFFYQAVLKFGWENISHQLYEVDTEEELKYLERYLISYYDTTNPDKGYNIAKGDVTQDQGRDHPEYGKSDNPPQSKETYRKYQTSEKGKEALKRYWESEKSKITRQQYESSEKGKEVAKRYRSSEKGKLTRQQWLASDKGKEAIKLANKRYDSSEKGKEMHRRAAQRYREKKKKQMKNE